MSGPEGAYLFDQGWQLEGNRLSGLSAGFDPVTIRLLNSLGVRPGWSCCEVGAGGGSIARWLADSVAPGGRVMVTDIDIRFLSALAGLPGVEVRQADVVSDAPPPGAFDVIHARAVLEYIPARDRVISSLVDGLRPGGVLLVEDVVIGRGLSQVVEPMVYPQIYAAALTKVLDAISMGFVAVGADPRFGPRLPGLMIDAGLSGVGAECTSRLVIGGTAEAEFYNLSLVELSDRLLAAGLLETADIELIDEMTRDRQARWPSVSMVSAWGYRKAS